MIKINIFFTAFLITLFAFGKSLSQDWFNYSDEECELIKNSLKDKKYIKKLNLGLNIN